MSDSHGVSSLKHPIYDNYEELFHRHHESYNEGRYPFDRYEIAYTYGFSLVSHGAYRHHRWQEIEEDVWRGWEERQAGPWEDFREAIRYAWETAQDAVRSDNIVGSLRSV